jgi:hypothetical protein
MRHAPQSDFVLSCCSRCSRAGCGTSEFAMSAPLSDENRKDKTSHGSRSRSRNRCRNNGPESANNETNNKKTSERRCYCVCHTYEGERPVSQGTENHPCQCDHCGPGRQRCTNLTFQGFRFCGDCRGDLTHSEAADEMVMELKAWWTGIKP